MAWIELEIDVRADTSYNFHTYVGACCDPAGISGITADDMVVHADNTTYRMPLGGKNSYGGMRLLLGSYDPEHGMPAKWGWASSHRITFTSGGCKRIRIHPGCQGTVVTHFVVSAERFYEKPPPHPKKLKSR